MSTFASLILQTVTLFALVAAIASVWHSFRHLIKCIDELSEAGRAQQSRIDSLAERVRVLESQRLLSPGLAFYSRDTDPASSWPVHQVRL